MQSPSLRSLSSWPEILHELWRKHQTIPDLLQNVCKEYISQLWFWRGYYRYQRNHQLIISSNATRHDCVGATWSVFHYMHLNCELKSDFRKVVSQGQFSVWCLSMIIQDYIIMLTSVIEMMTYICSNPTIMKTWIMLTMCHHKSLASYTGDTTLCTVSKVGVTHSNAHSRIHICYDSHIGWEMSIEMCNPRVTRTPGMTDTWQEKSMSPA